MNQTHEHDWTPKGPDRIADRCTVVACPAERVRAASGDIVLRNGDPPLRDRIAAAPDHGKEDA